jgi:sulfonate transport system substrate-binding protein
MTHHLTRRTLFGSVLGAAALGIAACAKDSDAGVTLTAAVPTEVPKGAALSIATHSTYVALQQSGQLGKLPFRVSQWANISAGPDVIQAFRGGSVDLANNAGIPPIQAAAIGFDAKIVAVQLNERPIYTFATAPSSKVRSLAAFKGAKIAFSQGQAQGLVVLRQLHEANLKTTDVTLVAMTSNQFLTALQSGQVDVAPLAEPQLTLYLNQYHAQGAAAITTDVVDLLSVLWAPAKVLADRSKAAAIRSFVQFWARAVVWEWEHPRPWIEAYYVKDQGVTAEAGQRIVKAAPRPVFPTSWSRALTWEQQSANLLSDAGLIAKQNTDGLFDRRFESVAAAAVPASYRR